ncbi:serine hydrolase [Virgibacillus xinjiangensis]|uniref:Serine hydrolase n=1 Tax=Virgibacillus xinjiangensis TaxID=393090 RepID=A0ABV7CS88_9BACI
MEELGRSIESIISRVGGTWAVVLEDLNDGKQWKLRPMEPMYAASIIKVPIMAAVFQGLENGDIKQEDMRKLKSEDQVGGCGVLQHMTPGISLPVYDLITLMIIQSDNTAANMLIDWIGADQIYQMINDIGMEGSMFHHKLMTPPAECRLENTITANDMNNLWRKLAVGEVVSKHASREMVDILKKQQLRHYLAGKLPIQEDPLLEEGEAWELADKTGENIGIRHNAGILYVEKRTMLATVLSKGVNERASLQALQEIGWEIYSFMKKQT